jgi:A/G-specific adenine glycosylase
MLQQTQVATVIPYFERFLQKFPDVQSLAQATDQDVLRLWEGLGYYRRARSLHHAAQKILQEHDGQIPTDPALLSKLPGLGRYTVNAILSQAHDLRLPILEANSQRVLCRLLGVEKDPRQTTVQKELWQIAETLLPRKHVGQFNQALMELGALVCTPTKPACSSCPLADFCLARKLNRQESIPARPAPVPIENVEEVALVLWRGQKVLLVQRPSSGRWASLWEFPHAPLQPKESHEQAALRLLTNIGFCADIGPELTTLRHGITRFRITLVCLEAHHPRGTFRSDFYPQAQWVLPSQLPTYPVSAPQRRLIHTLCQPRQPKLF